MIKFSWFPKLNAFYLADLDLQENKHGKIYQKGNVFN